MLIRPIPLFRRLLLELQSNCNRSCFFCNRTWDDSGKRLTAEGKHVLKRMPTEHALRIMDEAAALGFRGHVAFHHMSEPFLDPRIIDMAAHARKLGLRPYEHTNGDVLRRDETLCRAAAETFEYIKVGLYDHQNVSERDAQIEFWKQRLHGTDVRFSVVDTVFPRNLTPLSDRMIRAKQTFQGGICNRPLMRMLVHYDGNVALCCEDMKDDFGLGNAFRSSVLELWYSQRHQQIVRHLQRGRRDLYPLCKGCPIPPPEQPAFSVRIAKSARRWARSLKARFAHV
jgi:radical SAM protein with 4Fe4S-binding SPASM domain